MRKSKVCSVKPGNKIIRINRNDLLQKSVVDVTLLMQRQAVLLKLVQQYGDSGFIKMRGVGEFTKT